jgi:hypothetical protein
MTDLIFFGVIVLLIMLNVITILFYQKQVNALVDKVMCKNYPEFVQSKNLEQGAHFPNEATQEIEQVKEDELLRELNSIIM